MSLSTDNNSFIYRANNLPHPLNDEEYKNLEDVWAFITKFRFQTSSLHEYRKRIINTIRENYSPEEFQNLETIVEKLYWNLRQATHTQFLDDKHHSIESLTEFKEGATYEDLLNQLYKDTPYRSFINKLILTDDTTNKNNKTNKLYYKPMEGSSNIFAKNDFNLYTGRALLDRTLYESIMLDPTKITKISKPAYYYQFDYPFPNLNPIKPFIQSENQRTHRIKSMYFNKTADKSEENWFKLMRTNH